MEGMGMRAQHKPRFQQGSCDVGKRITTSMPNIIRTRFAHLGGSQCSFPFRASGQPRLFSLTTQPEASVWLQTGPFRPIPGTCSSLWKGSFSSYQTNPYFAPRTGDPC